MFITFFKKWVVIIFKNMLHILKKYQYDLKKKLCLKKCGQVIFLFLKYYKQKYDIYATFTSHLV